jgi:hypothetical protein
MRQLISYLHTKNRYFILLIFYMFITWLNKLKYWLKLALECISFHERLVLQDQLRPKTHQPRKVFILWSFFMILLVASLIGYWIKSKSISFQLLQKYIYIMADKTLVHKRLSNLPTKTSIPIGIQLLFQYVELLNNDVISI